MPASKETTCGSTDKKTRPYMNETVYTKDELLRMIANTLIVYSYHIENNGLTNGKTGAILFLYRYAARTGHKGYERFAGELLDDIMKMALSLPPDFENGLAGVGWTVSRLLSEGHVDGNPNQVLRHIDERVLGRIDVDRQYMLGQAVYMAERLRDATPDYDLSRHAKGMLDFIIQELSYTHDCPSLYHLNSALHFLVKVKGMQQEPEIKQLSDKLMAMLPLLYDRMNEGKRCSPADIHIHRLLLRQLDAGTAVPLHAQTAGCDNLSRDETAVATTGQFLRSAWQEMLYFGRLYTTIPSPYALSRFIDNKQESMQDDGFCIESGLAGLGLALMA